MFPDFTYTETAVNTDMGRSVVFDMAEHKFSLTDGAARECTGMKAVRQWCELLLHTKRDRFAVYGDTAFGISIDDLIGAKTLPEAYLISELKREILEGLALCPAIERADSFSFARTKRTLEVNFTVYLYTGESGEVTVNVGG